MPSRRRQLSQSLRTFLSRAVLILLALLVGAFGMRIWIVRSTPDLQPWHTLAPSEIAPSDLDSADWNAYLRAEDGLFAELASELQDSVGEADRVPRNRYYAGGSVYPGSFAVDWNRSFVMTPEVPLAGVVVLLHGLTDSPYSMRHLAELYRNHGFVALAPRLPAHGTVPGALIRIRWQDWLGAVRLAMREAARLSEGKLPVHLVGYSTGGALAIKYTLEALEGNSTVRPDRIVLLSPMIGITSDARYAGVAGWPAILPAFAKTAWLDVLPEFNPFKYNSFPVNAARQSYLLTNVLHRQLERMARGSQLADLPPILTFQSVADATVSTPAVLAMLYAYLPDNGSELVLFDINREFDFGLVMRAGAISDPAMMLGDFPHSFGTTVITNTSAQSREAVARSRAAGGRVESVESINLSYPAEVFSLSHVALPFPMHDGLYGMTPDPADDFGIQLGTLGMRGERGLLVDGVDMLTVRISSNPFFPYLVRRIEAILPDAASPQTITTAAGTAATVQTPP